MRWNAKKEPVDGDFKIVKKFAWTPKRINDKMIWLETYEQLYKWTIKQRKHQGIIGGYVLPLVTGTWGDWDFISEK